MFFMLSLMRHEEKTAIALPAFNFICLFKCFFCPFFKIFFVEPKFVHTCSWRSNLIDEVTIDHRVLDVLTKIWYRAIAIGLESEFTEISLRFMYFGLKHSGTRYSGQSFWKTDVCNINRYIPFQVGNWPIASEFALEKVSKSLQLFLHL